MLILHILKRSLTMTFLIAIAGCGGGDSSSGGQIAPVVNTATFFTTGLYNGTITQNFDGNGLITGEDDTLGITLEVLGNTAGSQQVRLAYVQFSGSSSILADGQFSIPSGVFPFQIVDQRDRLITTCNGALLFEGIFVGTSVTGTVTTTNTFTCASSRFGPVTISGTFEATFGSAKRHTNTSILTIRTEQ